MVLPILTIYTLLTNPDELSKRKKKESMGSIYLDLNVRSRFALAYNLVFYGRRVLYISIMFYSYCQRYQIIQVLLLITLNFCCLMYTLINKPFMSKQRNLLETFNEVAIFSSTELMLFYSGLLDPT